MRLFKDFWTVLLFVLITSCSEKDNFVKISVADYEDKVYASWLGQLIGSSYGYSHHDFYVDDPPAAVFPFGYEDESISIMKQVNGAFSNNNTDIEYMYLHGMEEYGPEPTYEQIAELWKHHVRGKIWLANRAALAAMHYGYAPPVTGKKEYNPHWFQIDAQLINEIWGVTAPGMVKYAAAKSDWAARITNDDWAIEPTIFYGSLYAAAFFESDIHKLIDIGIAALAVNSRFAQTAEEMKALYKKYPTDWKSARKEMVEKYYSQEPVNVRTVWNANLNGACSVLALLYGAGDFEKTLDYAFAMGFSAKNQGATLGGMMGIILGSQGLPEKLLYPFPELDWKQPFNDSYKNISRYDLPDASLKEIASRTTKLGEKIILKYGDKKIADNGKAFYLINTDAVFVPALEISGVPMPYIEVEKAVKYDFAVSGGKPPYQWQVISGSFPEGLNFQNGHLSGIANSPGVYSVTLEVISQDQQKGSRHFKVVVCAKNLAQDARQIIANVTQTDAKTRDIYSLSFDGSFYAENVQVIRDEKRYGKGSTFYSITSERSYQDDYYGYTWNDPQTIGLIGYYCGSLEMSGGWFTSLNVEYKDTYDKWTRVDNSLIYPPLPQGDGFRSIRNW